MINILHPVVPTALLLILIHTALVPAAAVKSMELKARFQRQLDSVRVRYEFPGATAAYVLPDGRMEIFATGFADLEKSIRMNPQARMLAASIGKIFVGAVTVTLVEEGLLCLEDPVSTWIGDKPWVSRLANHDSITLRHLLTHHAGIKDHIHTKQFMRAFAKHKGAKQPFPPEDLIGFILDRPALFVAGENWHYNDTGYILIGLIIESVTQTPDYDVLTQRFLQPLHLDLTTPSDRRTLPDWFPAIQQRAMHSDCRKNQPFVLESWPGTPGLNGPEAGW